MVQIPCAVSMGAVPMKLKSPLKKDDSALQFGARSHTTLSLFLSQQHAGGECDSIQSKWLLKYLDRFLVNAARVSLWLRKLISKHNATFYRHKGRRTNN
jgi:hypothetical protein